MNSTPPQDSPATNPPELQILHLETNLGDRGKIQVLLEHAGVTGNFSYAASSSEFLQNLASKKFDLILSDFSSGGYAGLASLRAAQSVHPEIPYLFVSGPVALEHAIECLKNGAINHLLKEHPERLVPAIRSALLETATRLRREAAEAALRISEERFREMAENIRDVFWVAGLDGRRFTYVSPAYAHLWGRPVADVLRDPSIWTDAVNANDRPSLETALNGLPAGKEFCVEYGITLPDGSKKQLEDRGYLVRDQNGVASHSVGVVVDLTQRRRMEEQLIHGQKMEAIGQLTGGIAHDFNNILTVISGESYLLLEEPEITGPMRASLSRIYSASERAVNLTRQLLVFSRQQSLSPGPVDLNQVVTETMSLCQRLISANIRVTLKLDPTIPTISADANMLEMVLLNLAINARDAMSRGGILTITTACVTLTEADLKENPKGKAGCFVKLSVTDTGCGIRPEIRDRIFEPFFTTKETGKGTGLGLATAFGAVTHHQGWLNVISKMGIGTTFEVFLPVGSPVTTTPVLDSPLPASVSLGKETILLVEDEQAVRDFTKALLEGRGYRVLEAASADEALETWKWHHQRIALVMTDIVMPGNLTGLQLAVQLRSEKPSLKVIYTSGYLPTRVRDSAACPVGAKFMQKPYPLKALLLCVRELLDAETSHA